MKNMWSDTDALNMVEHYAEQGVDEDMALRVYTTRLLGRNPELVLHSGGNIFRKYQFKTSVFNHLLNRDSGVNRLQAHSFCLLFEVHDTKGS